MSLFRAPDEDAAAARQRRAGLVARSSDEDEDPGEEVSAVLSRVRRAVRKEVEWVRIHGEVRSFTNWKNGAMWFFDLCDADTKISAKIRCVVKSDKIARVRFDVGDGAELIAKGRVEIKAEKSEIQLVVDSLERVGEGKLWAQLERIKERVREEGLFDEDRKKPLPLLPRRVGLVTSREGAAIHDMMRVLRERHPRAEIVLSPTRVQGQGASVEITCALQLLDDKGACDVIILARGGGAREDLFSFDMENVARAVAGCRTPIVAGVGHESDVTLAELVADVRAATPTYAATAAVPDVVALENHLHLLSRRLTSNLEARRDRAVHALAALDRRLPSPEDVLAPALLALEELDGRLQAAQFQRHREGREMVGGLEHRLRSHSPRRRMAADRQRLMDASRQLAAAAPREPLSRSRARLVALSARLDAIAEHRQRTARDRIATAARRLHDLSPLLVLTRGYAVVHKAESVVTRASQLAPADGISVRMHDGFVQATVVDVDLHASETHASENANADDTATGADGDS